MRAIQKSGQAAKQETRIINDFCALIWRQDGRGPGRGGRETGGSGCERWKEGLESSNFCHCLALSFCSACVCPTSYATPPPTLYSTAEKILVDIFLDGRMVWV